MFLHSYAFVCPHLFAILMCRYFPGQIHLFPYSNASVFQKLIASVWYELTVAYSYANIYHFMCIHISSLYGYIFPYSHHQSIIMVAFVTINSSLLPFIESLCEKKHFPVHVQSWMTIKKTEISAQPEFLKPIYLCVYRVIILKYLDVHRNLSPSFLMWEFLNVHP